ncbi:hypothetical protein EDC04DRAFT_2600386 [Pisolithus marmoratus]|nr:hypothetical protein EDC04DRAFT_2600386 [Pisolithus marmoratus]
MYSNNAISTTSATWHTTITDWTIPYATNLAIAVLTIFTRTNCMDAFVNSTIPSVRTISVDATTRRATPAPRTVEIAVPMNPAVSDPVYLATTQENNLMGQAYAVVDPNGVPGTHRTEEDRQWEEHRVLIIDSSVPGQPVNAFGIPRLTMRHVELAEGVSRMTELIAFAQKTKQGTMGNPRSLSGLRGSVIGLGSFQRYSAAALQPMSTTTSIQSIWQLTTSCFAYTSGQFPPPSQPFVPLQAGPIATPSMAAMSLKSQPSNTSSSPTTANAEPQKGAREGHPELQLRLVAYLSLPDADNYPYYMVWWVGCVQVQQHSARH